MAENLNFQSGNSWCYKNDENNCQKYGRLYDWNTAMIACPQGWHLPGYTEWNVLAMATGYKKHEGYWLRSGVGKKFKSKSGWYKTDWYKTGNGTDEFGFSALPGGYFKYPDSNFGGHGISGYWWSAIIKEHDAGNASHWWMYSGKGSMSLGIVSKNNGYSVRCIQYVEYP